MNQVQKYFDLQSEHRSVTTEGQSGGGHAWVWPQYVVLALGVIVEPFLHQYMATGSWDLDLSRLWGRIIFGLIVAIIILPVVYKASFDTTKPIVVQLAALFPMGIGWQALLLTATKAAQ